MLKVCFLCGNKIILSYELFFLHLDCKFKGKSTINLEKEILQKKIIIFDLPKGKLGRDAYTIGKFLVSKIKILAFKDNPNFYCHLFIDELQNFITSSLFDILEECRQYRLYLTMAQQQIGQGIDDIRKGKSSIMGNTGVKLTGVNGDDYTLSSISDSTGANIESLKKYLCKGVFSLWRVDLGQPSSKPVFVSIPQNIENEQIISKEQWSTLINSQLKRFYRQK